jgi:lipoprotein-releasing system permease protein
VKLSTEFALRYLRRRSSRLVSRVSWLAIAGVALGVMALVIAMGLLTGYRDEIQSKLIGANAEVVVFPLTAGGIPLPAELAARVRRDPNVEATAPVIYLQGTASSEAVPDGANAIVKGVDPAAERGVAAVAGSLNPTPAGPADPPGCSIGVDLARRLQVGKGETVVLTVPDASRRGSALSLRRKAFRVTRIFRTNFYEYDSEWVFVQRADARLLAALPSGANVLEVKLVSIEKTAESTARIRELAGDAFTVTDWRSLNGNLFAALTVQKITLFLLIGLIVAVSTFNIVATLVMNVQEKRRDIGVLSAIGAPPSLPSGIFLRLGMFLGGAGVMLGLALGSAVCLVITKFRLVSFPPEIAEIYFVSFVPFLLRFRDIAAISLFSLAVILAASYFPARRASRLPIAEALRYE